MCCVDVSVIFGDCMEDVELRYVKVVSVERDSMVRVVLVVVNELDGV